MNAPRSLNRRAFVKASATAAVAAMAGQLPGGCAFNSAGPRRAKASPALVDVNVTLGRWPFRRLPLDETPSLLAKLRRQGVTEAWAGTFDGLFYKDLASANASLAEDCRRQGNGLLLPFGSINPTLPGWEEDLRRCVETHQMRGIRLHPTYHRYSFEDVAFLKLLSLARDHRLIVQIAADMEDERTQSPLARAPHADFSRLPEALTQAPARIVLVNWFRSVNLPLVKKLAAAGASFDIATVEGVGGIGKLLTQIPTERILFGSHAPLFYFESALLKLAESELSTEQQQAIHFQNAQLLLRA